VHPASHLVSDCLQLSDQALGLRLPLDRELVRPGLAAYFLIGLSQLEMGRLSLHIGACATFPGAPIDGLVEPHTGRSSAEKS
jgi:hypothetical protein